ncbi:MAG: DUF4105 domain-containing protein [Bacteroidales bacterium]|nr:DUF4105 domain-containing protein [Bacteroidales bacterium]
MKNRLSILILTLLLFTGKLSAVETPRISLLTCTPGDELYSTFGHSALRVYNPANGSDLVFNFGLFDFNTPNFYTRFMRGKLEYMLGIQYMNDFLYQYQWEGRGVVEQVLSLDSVQTTEILAKLEYLYRPENRSYLYSFLYKNCTSELRDIIFDIAGKDEHSLAKSAGKTNRDLINEYIGGWPKFGINILLGSTLDRDIDVFQSMFLPDYLFNELTVAANGDIPLVSDYSVLLEKSDNTGSEKTFISKIIVALLSPIFILGLIAAFVGYSLIKKRYRAIEIGFLSIIGLLGIFISVLIMITDHRELYSNFNLLWCSPIYLFIVIASLIKWRKTEKVLSFASLLFLSLMVILWISGIQYAEPGFIIIVLTLGLSSFVRATGRY